MKNTVRKNAGLALMITLVLAAVCAWCAPRAGAKEAAHPSVALAGTVSSEAEGPMEGAVVKAKPPVEQSQYRSSVTITAIMHFPPTGSSRANTR